ncbi:MAG: hypothetical protein JXA97_01620 [Anaerolineales bacterium]|nr:hypothetical protein [Anaerolineales bacterium]
MRLSQPTRNVFYISVALGVIGLIAKVITIPILSPFAFWLVAIGFVLLVLGNVLKGF